MAGAKKYEVYSSQSAKGTYQKIGTVTATSYNDSELSAGQQYFYKVRAYRVVNNTNQYGTYYTILLMKHHKLRQKTCIRLKYLAIIPKLWDTSTINMIMPDCFTWLEEKTS